eukprot:CAMPEP_0197456130 /NCGR_PEP_ID=MMETSP1175-20131217/42579_1 /TAXON_ID=1003142 /ORGANISM="Triceratium dubium, Strain CCMP147" /LENGTH=54 /DNA_ID=CAMNT_0042990153 /DNA_START=63 /DNA_END=224 /DNA_ORIENTATION=+
MSEHPRLNDERNDGGGGEPPIAEGAAEGTVRDQQLASAANGAGFRTGRRFFSDG